jgi:16S rRNA (uracil1498-N3)-methyltransferase
MARVLRCRPGEAALVFDGSGREFRVSLVEVTPARASAEVAEELPSLPPPALCITLAQLVPRGGAMDWILAKATELGVARIVPLEGERSVRRAAGGRDRWQRILREAAEQSGRRALPELAPVLPLEAFLRAAGAAPLLVCEAGEGSTPLAEACRGLGDAPALTLLVGGEGGFTDTELAALRGQGAILAGLGPRLLRTDTAAVAALAVVQALLGDWRAPAGGAGPRGSAVR